MQDFYGFQPQPSPKKRSSTAVVISLILAVLVVAASVITVITITNKYDMQISGLQKTISQLKGATPATAAVTPEALKTSTSTTGVLPGLAALNSETTQIANKMSRSIVGIIINVPTSGRFGWQTQGGTYEGSGIILTQDGYIATNYHVVEPKLTYASADMKVQLLANGQTYEGKFVGGDQQNDLAVIKIDATGLVHAELGSSANVKVGEFAMAIGNPMGTDYAGSVTIGYISGLNRKVSAENEADNMIQTDAAINPGNSGGALVNAAGQVIGINTIKISDTNVEGLGFAIPIDFAKPILTSLMQYGYVKGRPGTGITGSEIDPFTAQFYNVPQGILVTDVAANSAAAKAGIQRNDIIMLFDGKQVATMSDITAILKTHQVGDTVSVQIYRNGQQGTVSMVLEESR